MKPSERRIEESERPRRQAPRPGGQIELGGKGLLGIFLALAVVCGLFFTFGYTIGHHTIPATFTLGSAPATKPAPTSTAAPAGVQPPNPSQLGAAETNQIPATLTPDPATTTPAAAAPTSASPGPAAAPGPSPNAQGVFQVLVFSGSQNDANSLAAALQAKSYPAAVVAPAANAADARYQVEVGPYLTRAEAEAMRSRLTADGYQATVNP